MQQKRRHKKRGSRARQKQTGVSGTFEGVIDHIGHRGDGVMHVEGKPVFAPYTVAGDQVRLAVKNGRGRVLKVFSEGDGRAAPVCAYYGTCGGCNLQHVASSAYEDWKVAQVGHALTQRGLGDVPIRPLITTAPGTRRRVTFSANRKGGRMFFGYYARASHDIVEITECPLLDPVLVDVLPLLRRITDILLADKAKLTLLVTTTKEGVDLAVSTEAGAGLDLTYAQRQDMADAMKGSRIERITLDDELLLQEHAPLIDMAGVSVTPPAGAFLQVSDASQTALQDLVRDGIADASHVADLFCGCGTFALALAHDRPVTAVDYDQAMLEGLRKAAAHTPGLKSITIDARNLFEGPLSGKELEGFDAVVFDPPRAGAKAQAEALANSDVPVIVGVSCDPGTFARDAQILYEGGYDLLSVTPVDQFLWSHHIEVVGVFQRG